MPSRVMTHRSSSLHWVRRSNRCNLVHTASGMMEMPLKNWNVYIAIVLGLLLCPLTGLHAAEVKLGFVNTAKVLEDAPQAEVARHKLENEFAPRDKMLVKAQTKLKKLEDKLARNGAVMSDDKRRELERDILSQKRDIKRSQDEFREDFNIRRNEELSKLQRQVLQAIATLAKEQHYDMILGDNSVLYASERVDVTQKVLDVLRKERKAASDKSGGSASQ